MDGLPDPFSPDRMSQSSVKSARLEALRPGFVGRGQALVDGGAVSSIKQHRLDDLLVLTALVADSRDDSRSHGADNGGNERRGQLERVYVLIDGERIDGDCTCDRRSQCEHVAAALLAARGRRARPGSSVQETRPPRPVTPATGQSMVYLLRLSSDEHDLSVCPSRRVMAADGQPVVTPYSLSRLEDARQPDYIGEDDLRILHELADRMAGALDLVWSPLGVGSHRLLKAMLATGRCLWNDANGQILHEAEAVQARLEWRLLPSGYQEPMLDSQADAASRQLPLLPPWRVNPETGACRPLATGFDESLVAELLEAGPVAPDRIDPLRRRLARAAPGLALPDRLQLERLERVPPVPQLELRMVELGSGQRFSREPAGRLSFAYGEVELDWNDEYASALVGSDRVLWVERDSEAEEQRLAELEALGLAPLQTLPGRDYRPGEGGLLVARQASRAAGLWIDLQASLKELEARGWRLSGRADFSPRLVSVDEWYGDLRAPADRPDEFDLDLGVLVDGERLSLLPALLKWIEHTPSALIQALIDGAQRDSSNRGIVLAVDEQRVVLMPTLRLGQTLRGLVDALDELPRLKHGRLRLPRARLAELASASLGWHLGGDEALAELTRRLANFSGIEAQAAPAGFRAELRSYQALGLGWMQFLREYGFGGILADDMGLGKTIQTLAHIATEKAAGRLDRPALVIVPTSLLFNWRAEARRFAPELKLLTLHGPERKGQFQWIDESDLVLTTYPLLSRDAGLLARHDFHLLILDEAQSVKNPRTQAAREVRRLRARHRLCLSGTPLENHLGELWALFDFLMPGMLGSQSRFRSIFRRPIEREDDDDRRATLSRRIRPFFLRRTKAEVAPELPPKTEMIRAVALEGAQRRLYERYRVAMHDKVRRALAGQGLDKSRIVVLDALLRLRQICCDPALLKGAPGSSTAGSAKRDLLMELLPELVAEGRRVLVFSQFVQMLKLIQGDLKRLAIEHVTLTGQTRDRQAVVERFQAGQVPVFLISLKAGGVGLNLTAADTVIHYDPWWNPAVEDQATDRAHRIGQDQKVFVYRLLTEQTVEEKVFQLQQTKRGLIEGLLGGGGAVDLAPEDLDALFEPLA